MTVQFLTDRLGLGGKILMAHGVANRAAVLSCLVFLKAMFGLMKCAYCLAVLVGAC